MCWIWGLQNSTEPSRSSLCPPSSPGSCKCSVLSRWSGIANGHLWWPVTGHKALWCERVLLGYPGVRQTSQGGDRRQCGSSSSWELVWGACWLGGWSVPALLQEALDASDAGFVSKRLLLLRGCSFSLLDSRSVSDLLQSPASRCLPQWC